jgi:putative mRNA 3-end processing factor
VGRRPRAVSIAPVTWRDGVHLSGTPIWCDARRRRDICFVSSADRVGRTGHGQLIGSPITLALLGAKGDGHLAVPLRQRFTLGTLRLELIPSGRGLGAAALHVDAVGRTVLHAGPVRTLASSWYEAAEVRACDALVIDAPLGELHHELEPIDDVVGRVIEWTREQLAAGLPTVVVVDSVLDGIEVTTRLLAEGVPVSATKPLRDAVARVAGLATVPTLRAPGREPSVMIRIEGERARVIDREVRALVSYRAIDAAQVDASFAASFAWPFVASRTQLLAWIEQTRAREIFVTGASADAIAEKLGARARVIGPPRQMALFAI